MEIPKSTMGKNIYITMDERKPRYRIINGATIYKWIKEPEFPKQIKIGGKALWSRNEIELYDEKQMAKR